MRQPLCSEDARPSDIVSRRRLRGSRRHQVRIGLFAGGRWIRTSSTRAPRLSAKPSEAGSQRTLCWREMDSNFRYASTVRWHRATDLLLPPTVKRRSAGRPPPMARRRSEAQRGSVRPAAAMRSTLAKCGAPPPCRPPAIGSRGAPPCGPPICEIRPGENVTLQYLSHDGRPAPRRASRATVRPAAAAPKFDAVPAGASGRVLPLAKAQRHQPKPGLPRTCPDRREARNHGADGSRCNGQPRSYLTGWTTVHPKSGS